MAKRYDVGLSIDSHHAARMCEALDLPASLSCRRRDHRRLGCWPSNAESALMERFADVQPVRLIDPRAAGPLRLAIAAYLARYTGSSRDHAHSDLRCFRSWCAERGLDPLAASRVHLELYIRWMQEVRRFIPSTVSRRFSVTAGFYAPP